MLSLNPLSLSFDKSVCDLSVCLLFLPHECCDTVCFLDHKEGNSFRIVQHTFFLLLSSSHILPHRLEAQLQHLLAYALFAKQIQAEARQKCQQRRRHRIGSGGSLTTRRRTDRRLRAFSSFIIPTAHGHIHSVVIQVNFDLHHEQRRSFIPC